MTIDKDKLLILGVVAVLGFFLWKSRRDSEAKRIADENAAAAAGNAFAGVDKYRVNSIVSALGLDPVVRETVSKQANWAISCKNNPNLTTDQKNWVKGIVSSAASNRITYEQQAVIEGLWVAYMSDEHCILKDPDSYESYRSMVLSM